jgi:hypothetical protein
MIISVIKYILVNMDGVEKVKRKQKRKETRTYAHKWKTPSTSLIRVGGNQPI